jgi:hypothetical protein
MHRWILLCLAIGCGGATEAQRDCEAYAFAFASASARRCDRGTLEQVAEAFKDAAGVGRSCELVQEIRDPEALREVCLPWIEDEVSCDVLDDASAYLDALPEACRGQLRVTLDPVDE